MNNRITDCSYALAPSGDADGTYHFGELVLSPRDVIRCFGSGASADEYKISRHWVFRKGPLVFTLYDWKLTSLCDIALWTPEELWASDEPVELNIGSKAPATASDAADFIAFLARTTSAVPDAVAGTQIFAPVDFWSGVRLMLRISEQDIPRGRRWRRTVVDLETGRRYRAWSASCDLPGCLCDAYVEEIPRGSSD